MSSRDAPKRTTIHEPYIFLFLGDGALHVGKKLPTEPAPREIFDVPLNQIVSYEFEEAARRLGSSVFGILKLWHQAELKAWADSGQADGTPPTGDLDLALELIARMSAGATSEDRLQLIDELLTSAAKQDSFADKYLREDWPPLRKRLLKQA